MAGKKGGKVGDQSRSMELLWGERGRPTRGPKPVLSVERIARAAIDLADAEGLAAVSMERVASTFGFTTMSLYRYVPGKAELVALMIETGIGPPPSLDAIEGGWRPKLEAWSRALWKLFVAHPWTLEASQHLRLMGPNELAWLEIALRALGETGLSGKQLFDAVLVLNGHIRIVAQFSASAPSGQQGVTGEQWGMATAELVREHRERFPALAATLASEDFSAPEGDPLEFGMRVVLDGIGVLVAERAGKKHARR